jgi:hypothetical protein
LEGDEDCGGFVAFRIGPFLGYARLQNPADAISDHGNSFSIRDFVVRELLQIYVIVS